MILPWQIFFAGFLVKYIFNLSHRRDAQFGRLYNNTKKQTKKTKKNPAKFVKSPKIIIFVMILSLPSARRDAQFGRLYKKRNETKI